MNKAFGSLNKTFDSDFQIFTDLDRKQSELLYAINCDPISHFVLAQKRTVQGQTFADVYGFIMQKKFIKILKSCFLKMDFFKIPLLKPHVSNWIARRSLI